MAKRKSERTQLVVEADKYFSRYIRERDLRCVTCGKASKRNQDEVLVDLQCGHLFTRSFYPVRWDPRNAFAQCPGCNLRHEHDPAPLTLVFMNQYSMEEYEQLYSDARTVRKYTNNDLKEIIEEYKKLWKGLVSAHKELVWQSI